MRGQPIFVIRVSHVVQKRANLHGLEKILSIFRSLSIVMHQSIKDYCNIFYHRSHGINTYRSVASKTDIYSSIFHLQNWRYSWTKTKIGKRAMDWGALRLRHNCNIFFIKMHRMSKARLAIKKSESLQMWNDTSLAISLLCQHLWKIQLNRRKEHMHSIPFVLWSQACVYVVQDHALLLFWPNHWTAHLHRKNTKLIHYYPGWPNEYQSTAEIQWDPQPYWYLQYTQLCWAQLVH